MTTRMWWIVIAMIVVPSILGCSPEGHQLSDEEWDQVFGMPADNTETAKELVEHDSRSREQWLSLHEDLQSERTEIGRQRDRLEEDRRLWAQRERDDAVVAESIGAAGLLVACVLPLLVVVSLLKPRKPEPSTEVVNEILVADLCSESRKLGDDAEDTPRRLGDPP